MSDVFSFVEILIWIYLSIDKFNINLVDNTVIAKQMNQPNIKPFFLLSHNKLYNFSIKEIRLVRNFELTLYIFNYLSSLSKTLLKHKYKGYLLKKCREFDFAVHL